MGKRSLAVSTVTSPQLWSPLMPLIRISMRRGHPASHPAAIVDGVYRALRATFEVPENDLFAVVHQHEAEEFVFDANYFGFQRSDRLVIIQITVANTRGV